MRAQVLAPGAPALPLMRLRANGLIDHLFLV
jgi:hypothetical protein